MRAAIRLLLGTLLVSSPAFSDVKIRFVFFEERGKELDYSAVVKRMTADYPEGLSSGTFDLGTLKALRLNKSFEDEGGRWTTPFLDLDKHPKQGVMVHWNTKSSGYSTFLLDNLGQGFTENKTYVFNERLAYDARRHLSLAMATKRDYKPSERFQRLRAEMDRCFEKLDEAEERPDRGRLGQACLDLVAQSMTRLLREYGEKRARELTDPWWGVTVAPLELAESIEDEYEKIDRLTGLFGPRHRWARIAMVGDGSDELPRLRKIAEYARRMQTRTMGQLFDSTRQVVVPLKDFKSRVDQFLNYPGLDLIDAWEVGNEVNGRWLGKDVAPKIEYAAKRVKDLFPRKTVCLTFYWYSMQDRLESSLFNWIDEHVTDSIRKNLDCVGLSIYVDQEPLGFLWDMVLTKLSERFPGKRVIIGETYYVDASYREAPDDWTAAEALEGFLRNRYASSFATPNATGGMFWWTYEKHLMKDTPYREGLRDLYCAIYPDC